MIFTIPSEQSAFGASGVDHSRMFEVVISILHLQLCLIMTAFLSLPLLPFEIPSQCNLKVLSRSYLQKVLLSSDLT